MVKKSEPFKVIKCRISRSTGRRIMYEGYYGSTKVLICQRSLRERLQLPDRLQRLWFELYRKSQKECVQIKNISQFSNNYKVDNKLVYFMPSQKHVIESIFEEIGQDHFYVKVKYEE